MCLCAYVCSCLCAWCVCLHVQLICLRLLCLMVNFPYPQVNPRKDKTIFEGLQQEFLKFLQDNKVCVSFFFFRSLNCKCSLWIREYPHAIFMSLSWIVILVFFLHHYYIEKAFFFCLFFWNFSYACVVSATGWAWPQHHLRYYLCARAQPPAGVAILCESRGGLRARYWALY